MSRVGGLEILEPPYPGLPWLQNLQRGKPETLDITEVSKICKFCNQGGCNHPGPRILAYIIYYRSHQER